MRLAVLAPPALLLALVVGSPAAGQADSGGGPTAFRPPVVGAVVTQPFGCTALELEPEAPQCPGGHFHSGIDLAAAMGTPVQATAAGVASVANQPLGYGLHVVLNHGGGRTSLYGHLSVASVAPGQPVAAGQEVGRIGSSGLSTGPHLHFEIRRGGAPVDPAPLIYRRN